MNGGEKKYMEAHGLRREEMAATISYLTFFGYLGYALVSQVTKEDIELAVKVFQKWFGLKRDGVVGPKTMRAIMQPRCGLPDRLDSTNPDHQDAIRMAEAAKAQKKMWKKKGLKWYVKSYIKGVSRSAQNHIFHACWEAWDKACGLEISRSPRARSADLIIDTGEGKRSFFDGPGGTLAWAYMPGEDNTQQLTMKFDLGETWVESANKRGVLLFNVACHEFGHMLGLSHIEKEGALMSPWYNPLVATPQWDDTVAIQRLYGKDNPVRMMLERSECRQSFRVTCSDLKVDGYELVPGSKGGSMKKK